MKKLTALSFSFLSIALLISCSSDGGDDGNPLPSYDFIDRDLQGKIDGQNWTYAAGFAEDSFFEEGNLSIEMTNETYDNPCDEFLLDGLKVFFDIEAQVGLKELKFAEDGQTITLFNPATSLNIILVEGAVEILSITTSEVSGRIDGRSDEDNFINGNFTVPYCLK